MIDFQNVNYAYKDKLILKDLTFSIKKGELIAIVGESGSGKTTLLKLINGLNSGYLGTISIENTNLQDWNLRELRLSIGYVLQQIALFPNLTVLENVTLIPEMKQWSKEERLNKAEQLLEKVGLSFDVFANCYPNELSGGQQQRVGIARALVGEPNILLMDEPFSALDVMTRETLQDLTRSLLNEFKMTCLFVTHDIKEAIKMADKIMVLKEGVIEQFDTVDNLKNKPSSPYVAQLFKGELYDTFNTNISRTI